MSETTDKGRSPQGEELSPFELDLMRKMFSYPRIWPDTAKVWIADYVSQNSLLSIGQVQGFTQFTAQSDTVLSSGGESTTSTTYTDLATVGPSISGLSPGQYLLLFGAQASLSAADAAVIAPSINGAAASDDNCAVNTVSSSFMRAVQVTLPASTNSAVLKYRTGSGTTITFLRRWMVALKVANP